MADFNLKFILSVLGADQVDKSVEKVGKTGQKTAVGLSAVGEAGRKAASGTNAVNSSAGKAATALNGAGKAADTLSSGLKKVASGGTAMSGLVGQLDKVESKLHRVADAQDRWRNLQGKAHQLTMAGAGVAAVGGGLLYGAKKTLDTAAEMQLQKATISAVTHSEERGNAVFNYADDRSVASVYSLDELVGGAKTLETRGLKTEKYLTATDDLAATNLDTGATPADVARAMGRIKAGDYGEGFERLRDFGIARGDLENQGLKFDKGGAYSDQTPEGAQKAVDAVVAVVEEKFGGLSERLATGTFAGAVSNFGDAISRMGREIGEEILPTAQAIVKFATGLSTLVVGFTKAHPVLAKVIAYGLVLGGAFLVVAGGALMLIGTLAGAFLNVMALAGAQTVNSGATTTNTLAKNANTLATEENAIATGTASTSLMGSAITAATALGLLAIAIAGFYIAIKGSQDAGSMSDKDLKDKWGPLGEFWVYASGSDKDPGADADDKKLYDNYVKTQTRNGRDVKGFDEWRGHPTADDAGAGEDMRTPEQKQKDAVEEQTKKTQESVSRQINETINKHLPSEGDPTRPGAGDPASGADSYNVGNRLEQLPGRKVRVHFDDIDLGEPSIQRQGRHYTNNRPS